MRIEKSMTLYEKLNILTDAAKYDVACTSSGTQRKNDGMGIGSCQQSDRECNGTFLLQGYP